MYSKFDCHFIPLKKNFFTHNMININMRIFKLCHKKKAKIITPIPPFFLNFKQNPIFCLT